MIPLADTKVIYVGDGKTTVFPFTFKYAESGDVKASIYDIENDMTTVLDKDYYAAVNDYNSAILHGIVKIASKMGISTIQSYQGSKIFEAIGISQDVIGKYFTGTVSRVGGKIGRASCRERV